MDKKKSAPQEREAEKHTVKDLLEKADASVDALAEIMDVDVAVVDEWIKGHSFPKATQVVELAAALRCTEKEVYLAILHT